MVPVEGGPRKDQDHPWLQVCALGATTGKPRALVLCIFLWLEASAAWTRPRRAHGGRRTMRGTAWRPAPQGHQALICTRSILMRTFRRIRRLGCLTAFHLPGLSVMSVLDRDPNLGRPEATTLRCDFHDEVDEVDVDFSFGTRPEVTAPPAVDLVHTPRRPKAAGKMLVRSGLRCPRCLLKAWVCLCNRAPREIDRRGAAPKPSERYRHSRTLAPPRAGGLRMSGSFTQRAGHSGSVILALSSMVPWYTLHILPGGHCSSSYCLQRLIRISTCQSNRPHHRRTNTAPNRGPKSALVPDPRITSQCQCRRQGVRVSSLSAGDEGLCNAQPIFPIMPGKPADGNYSQLGDASYSFFAHTQQGAQLPYS